MKAKTCGIAGVCLFGASVMMVCGCSTPKAFRNAPVSAKLVEPASFLPGTKPEMTTVGYWLSRVPEPDKVILSAEQIRKFNERTVKELKLNFDLMAMGYECDGVALRKAFDATFQRFAEKQHYFADGTPVSAGFLDSLKKEIALEDIPKSVGLRYGFVTKYADLRLLPTFTFVTLSRGDTEFDEMQNSSLDMGTAVAVLRETQDRRWVYVHSADAAGWILKESVAFCPREAARVNLENPDIVVVTSPKTDVYSDPALTRSIGFCRMGSRFQYAWQEGSTVEIFLPARDDQGDMRIIKAYLPVKNVHRGYLAYTPRNILSQAFAMLNAPYAWGGARGEQDCSSFLQQVFATCGIMLPRNSASQIELGRKAKELSDALPAQTFLGMPGHIMLYVGSDNGEPFAIHAVWAYREPSAQGDIARVINRVAVTSLRLGEGSSKGSWGSRINRIQVLDQ